MKKKYHFHTKTNKRDGDRQLIRPIAHYSRISIADCGRQYNALVRDRGDGRMMREILDLVGLGKCCWTRVTDSGVVSVDMGNPFGHQLTDQTLARRCDDRLNNTTWDQTERPNPDLSIACGFWPVLDREPMNPKRGQQRLTKDEVPGRMLPLRGNGTKRLRDKGRDESTDVSGKKVSRKQLKRSHSFCLAWECFFFNQVLS